MLHPPRFSLHAIIGIVLISAWLSACSPEPTPIEPKTEPPSASTRPSPKPKVPVMPAIARRHDATGAANFVLYWVRVSNYAAKTGDTARLREISAPDCEGCNRYIDLYEKTYAAGGYFKGSDWKLSAISSEDSGSETLIRAHVDAPDGQFRNSRRDRTRRGNSEDSDLAFFVEPHDHQWELNGIVLQSELRP